MNIKGVRKDLFEGYHQLHNESNKVKFMLHEAGRRILE